MGSVGRDIKDYKLQEELSNPIAFAASTDPDTMYHHEAMRQPDWDKFLKAMEEEVASTFSNSSGTCSYGQKQASRVWNKFLHKGLLKAGCNWPPELPGEVDKTGHHLCRPPVRSVLS